MNILNAIASVLLPFWWLILPLFLVGLLKVPEVKGCIGELVVRAISHFMLDKSVYHRLDNLTLPSVGGSTQIDHVIVSCYGIFVVETKNMSGWIFGSEDQAMWTQQLYQKRLRFQNPLRQNFRHIKALESLLQVPGDTLHSVIAFVGTSTFKTPMPRNVTYGAGYADYIKSFKVPVFSRQQVKEFVQQLKSPCYATTFAKHRDHVQALGRRSSADTGRQCPRCGGTLVLRSAKTKAAAGKQFWGCSNFPRCRMTKPFQ